MQSQKVTAGAHNGFTIRILATVAKSYFEFVESLGRRSGKHVYDLSAITSENDTAAHLEIVRLVPADGQARDLCG